MTDTPNPGSTYPGNRTDGSTTGEWPEETDNLDGHTIDELSDYLDRGREPRDPGIEQSPGCLIALDGLAQLRQATTAMIEADAAAEPERDEAWISRVMGNISRDARAGRDIPISHPDPAVILSVSEGSIRGLIRAAGDETEGIIVGRCELRGDVTVPGEPIAVTVTASVAWGRPITEIADAMRRRVYEILAQHTELTIASVDIEISDIHEGGRTR